MATIIINNSEYTIPEGEKLNAIQMAQRVGVDVPYYCWHPALSVVANCRMCEIEVGNKDPKTGEIKLLPKLVPGCQTPAKDGTVLVTNSPKVKEHQRMIMEYLLLNHPLDCPVCDQAGECHLQDYSYKYGRSESRFEEDKAKKPKKDVGDHIYLYSDRCIMCTRCVRFTREISGSSELFVEGRGFREEIDIFPGKPCNNKLAGNVVDLCPVGALLDKDFLFKQRVWLLQETPSISPVDSGGENIFLDQNEGVVYRIRPRENPQVNKWWISDDSRYSYKILTDPRRLKQAMHKEHGAPVAAPFSAAVAEAAAGLKSAAFNGGLYAVLSPMMSC
jgi:NADH-quinone oxidoreductase subunit G